MEDSELFAFMYPTAAEQGIGPKQVLDALELAEDYAPATLRPRFRQLARVHYAAHLLVANGSLVYDRVVRREREGNVEREYQEEVGTGINAPVTPYQRWEQIVRAAGRGAITVSVATPGRALP